SKKKIHDYDASGSKQPPVPQSSVWKTFDTREAPSSSSKQKFVPHSKQPIKDVPIPDDMNISDSEDTDTAHLPKIKTRPDWLKPVPKEDRLASPKPDWFQMEKCHLLLTDQVDLVNPECHRVVPNVSKPLPLGGPPGQIKSEREYDISAAYGISHWWFKRKEFYITRHSAPSDRSTVKSYMRILSVVSLKTYERYGYNFLKEIVLHRADYKEYKISEADFKNMHPDDFEDLYLLHLQGHLNHLSGADKVHLFNAVNLWIRNIVIRKHVEDLQLGIEIYQTKLNLTQPDWDASDFLFKEDYTIVSKLRAVIYRDRNDQKKMMRETEMHKFSDGTLNRILDKLDHMVKDFKLFKYNLGMETRIWFEDDRRRSKEFMEVIERRLKIRRIFRSLECFIGGRLRDVDYKLIQITK
ncbi:hypothetical protein Tco_1469546, partial [Tanacetum coccineum]